MEDNKLSKKTLALSLVNKVKLFFKSNWSKMVFVFFVLCIPSSLFSIFDNNIGYKSFSKTMNDNGQFNYQISTSIDQSNFDTGRKFIKEYSQKLGIAYYSMNIFDNPLAYLYSNSKIHPESCVSLNSNVLSPVNFSAFGVTKVNEDGNNYFFAGSSNIDLLFSANAGAQNNYIRIYISDKVADSLLLSLHLNNYEELMGYHFEQEEIPGNPFVRMAIVNIYNSNSIQAKELHDLIGDFFITSRFLDMSSLTSNIRVGALINKKEYTNVTLLKTFVSYFNENEIEIQTKNDASYSLKYTNLFKKCSQSKYMLIIHDYVFLGVSLAGIWLYVILFITKKIRFKEFFDRFSILNILLPLLLLMIIQSITSTIFKALLFGSIGLVFTVVYSIIFVIYFKTPSGSKNDEQKA